MNSIHPSVTQIWKRFEHNNPSTELEGRAFDWIADNPDAFIEMMALAEEAYYDKHYEHWSIAGIVEIIRWQRPDIITKGSNKFRLCNSHRATFARLINEHLKHNFFIIRGNKGHVGIE